MATNQDPYPGASNRERNHARREDENPRGAIRDRGRGRQITLENEARNNDNANQRGGRGRGGRG